MSTLLFILLLMFMQLNSAATSTSCSLIMSINKQGFHRELTTSVLFVLPSNFSQEQSQCVIVLKKVLPTGAYIDPHQLHRMKEIQIAFQSKVDVEKPEFLSPPQTLLVYVPLQPSLDRQYLKAEVTLPFHLRYHQPEIGDSRATINVDPPTDVFTNCSDGSSELEEMACSSSDSSLCLWQRLNCKASPVATDIPVGNYNHLIPVTVITMLSAFSSTAFLLRQMHKQHQT